VRTTLISIGRSRREITVILCVATTLAERKVIGYMQVRIGPNRVVVRLLQPFADVIKLLLKEVVVLHARTATCSSWRRC